MPSHERLKSEAKRASHSLPILDRPWQSIGMDLWVHCLYPMVAIDRFTLEVHLIPTTTWVAAKEVAWLFLKEIVQLHGVPESIVSDHDTKFTSRFWKELHRLLGMKLLMSTAIHPQMV